MKVKLDYFSIPLVEYPKLYPGKDYGMTLLQVLGSEQRLPGMVVEGMVVPAGEVWLFPHNEHELRALLTQHNIPNTYHKKYVNV